VTLEGHAVIVNLAGLREGKDLEAARVREHGIRPLHEFVQAAQITDEFVAGAKIQVIGIAQNERGVDIFEMFGGKCLDCSLRANRREDRCLQISVRGGEDSRAGAAVLRHNFEIKHEEYYTVVERLQHAGAFY